MQDLGGKLYDILFRPAEGLLSGVTRLVVCPDVHILELPFSVLAHGRGSNRRFLGLEMPIAYALSFGSNEDIARRARVPSFLAHTLAAFGDPELPDSALPPLPAARAEASRPAAWMKTRDR